MGDTIGTRILSLMGEQETQQQLADSIGVSRESVKAWINGYRRLQIDDLTKLAKHFNVSTDYLLGMDVPKSKDPDIQMICTYTGLSETAVEVLHYATLSECEGPISYLPDVELDEDGTARVVKENPEGIPEKIKLQKESNMRTVRFINRVLERVHLPEPEWRGQDDVDTIFSDMEDYVTLESAWIDDNPYRNKRELLTVHYGNKTLVGLRVDEVIKVDLMGRIGKCIDAIREEHFKSFSPKKPRKRKTTGSQSNG